MSDLSALIVALEGATGPSRELDGEIALVAGYRRNPSSTLFNKDGYVWAEPGERFSYGTRPPEYTSSIDAALTLGRSSAEKFRMLEAVFRADYPADEARHLFTACKAVVLDALKARQASSTQMTREREGTERVGSRMGAT